MKRAAHLKDIIGKKDHLYEDRDAQGREPQKMLGLSIPVSLHQRFKAKAAEQGISMTQALIEAMETYLDKN